MILSMSRQVEIFLMTTMLGCVFWFSYDIIRIIRKIFPHKNFFIQIEDAIYWSVISFLMFYFMLYTSYGEIRIFSIIGVFLGMVLYALLVSPLFMKVSDAIIEFMKKVLLVIIHIFLMPIKAVISFFTPTILFIYRFFLKKQKNTVVYLKKVKMYFYRKKRKVLKELKIISKKH